MDHQAPGLGAAGGLPFRLRPGRPEDAGRIHDIHTQAVRMLCAPYYEARVIDGWLQGRSPAIYVPLLERGALFVAGHGPEVLGFGEAVPGNVLAVYVDPPAAGRGIGSAILRHAIGVARQGHEGAIRLEASLNACSFYERHGFRETHRKTVRRNRVEIAVAAMELPARQLHDDG
jgi:GNAT superfamily N-acetyltransferase